MKNLLILAAHKPSLDPRINWIIDYATAHKYNTTIFGLENNYSELNNDNIKTYILEKKRPGPGFFLVLLKRIPTGLTKKFVSIAFLLCLPLTLILTLILDFISVAKKSYTYKLISSVLKQIYNPKQHIARLKNTLCYAIFEHFLITANTFFQFYTELKIKIDTIHANDLDTLLAGILIKRVSNARLVYDAHEFYPHQFINAPKWLVCLFSQYENLLIKSADEVVTVTPQLAKCIEDTYHLSNHVHVIPNCAPLMKTQTPLKNMDGHNIEFLFQGNFATGRGQDTLITYWSRLNPKNCRLTLRGPNSAYKESCVALAGKLGTLNKSIFFAEAVSEDQLIQSAAKADIGIIPYEPVCINNKYCCPNKLSQYMQAGLLVLTNDLPFVSEKIHTYSCGLIYDHTSFESFASAINKISNDHDFVRKCKENSLHFSKTDFYWEKAAANLITMYETRTPATAAN